MCKVEKVEHCNRVCYYKKGTTILYREDGPAIEYSDGERQWWVNGRLNREDGPAIEFADGTKRWYVDGKLHREDGPAIVRSDGSIEWYLNGYSFSRESWLEALTEEQKVKAFYSEYFIGV
jgi:hypothetical protein